MSSAIRFYNPREAAPEVLEAMLVGREGIVQEVLDDLDRQAVSSSRQHWLIRGPRGIGKTHLVGILYHRLRRDEKLAPSFLPIWLAETDAYSAYSAAVLLLQIAERLVEELRLSGDPGAEEVARKLAELASGGDDPALFEEACTILREEAQSRGKILVVLMENLDALLTSLPGQRGAQEVRRLRSLLSQDKELLFVSTTPTRYLAAVSDPKQPLYGHLTEDEVGQLLERLAEVTGQAERLASLREEREGKVRRRVLHRLTGGNPRAVVVAFTVLSGAPGVQSMVEEMSALLDTQTAYFEARLAQLAPRERAIVGAMALSPKNLTLQEIAHLTRLPLRSLSVQIDRLREQGYIAMATGDGGKGSIYEVSDGLFRVWYQYRKGRKVLQPLVQFLAIWYPDDELENTLLALREAASQVLVDQDISRLAEVQILEALRYSRSEEGQAARRQMWSVEPSKEDISRFLDRSAFTSHHLTWNDDADESIRLWVRYASKLSITPSVDRWILFASIFSLEITEAVLHRVSFSPVTEDAEAARLFLNVIHVLKAEAAVGSSRRTSPKARRQEALAQVTPELRSTVDEIAQKIRAVRQAPRKDPKESPPRPGGALPL
jgi:hypothetical protein